MTKVEFDLICRLCAQIFDREKVSPIFNNDICYNKILLSEKIKYCSAVEVAENDGLPPQICQICMLKLNESFVFRNQCVLADIILKHMKKTSFIVNELPPITKIDLESQIIKSENDILIQDIYYSLDKSGEIRTEKVDEFDNSKNGRHKRVVDKLKDISFTKALTETIKNDHLNNTKLPESESVNFKKHRKEKFTRKNIVKKNVNNIDSKIKKPRKLNKIKQSKSAHLEEEKSKQEEKRCVKIKHVLINSEIQDKQNECDAQSNLTIQKKRKKSCIKEKPSVFNCDHCQKVYPSEGGLRYHIHTMHNKDYQPFICDLCGKPFKVKKNLEAHKNSIHFHLKHHLCDLCGRGFASKYSLKVHKSWHNDEKNFTCDVCGTKFRTRGKMNTHRSIHGGFKKFMCHICSRDFRWKNDFEIHMRTHTGEKPFKCSFCGKTFASLTNMKKHEKNHLKKEVSKVTEKNAPIIENEEEKLSRNEFCDFGFGSEDVRNRQINQVSANTFFLICK